MALIVITIRDNDDAVDVSLVDEPPISATAVNFTPAQTVGAAALDAIRAVLDKHEANKPRIITLDAVKLLDED